MNITSEKIQIIFEIGVDFQTVNIPDKGTAIIIKKDDIEKVNEALT